MDNKRSGQKVRTKGQAGIKIGIVLVGILMAVSAQAAVDRPASIEATRPSEYQPVRYRF
jgi:hypothetical protein